MKLKRAKAYKKQMAYLNLNFGYREPYQVLVDEEIVLEAVRIKYDLVSGLERTLNAKIKIFITQCSVEHLYRAKVPEAIELAKTFERRRCGHLPPDGTLSVYECMVNVVGDTNKNRYVIATQKPKLRQRLRLIPATPIINLHRSVMVMEPMSVATEEARAEIEAQKLTSGLNSVRPSSSELHAERRSTKSKAVKGPNPLSVKKRQHDKVEDERSSGTGQGQKRRKRGKKLSKQSEQQSLSEQVEAAPNVLT